MGTLPALFAAILLSLLSPLPFLGNPGRSGDELAQRALPSTEVTDSDLAFELAGRVLLPDGRPAEGAVVLCSAGGRASTGCDGFYRLSGRVAGEASEVELQAYAQHGGLTLGASATVSASRGTSWVAPLFLGPTTACPPRWIPAFGTVQGVQGEVLCLAVFDDGNGPALFAGGTFATAGGQTVQGIARWSGSEWSDLGGGVNGSVTALTVFDDGNGPALYVGGTFTQAGVSPANRIARWSGTSWSALGSGVDGGVDALAVFDSGSGARLVAGGSFTHAGGVAANRIGAWDGASWAALGSGLNGGVSALATFDEGSGARLFVGGAFSTAGGASANRVARWNGSAWSALGSGVNQAVLALAVHDDGSGEALFVGGNFTLAGGNPASRIARWSGTAWSALGAGLDAPVTTLASFDSGSGPALFVGGNFATAGGNSARSLARWSGSSFAALGTGDVDAPVSALCTFDDGSGARLYCGGAFTFVDGQVANHLAAWDGASWTPFGGNTPNNMIEALAVFDDGSGAALYAGGDFTAAGGVAANRIARWDGTTWTPLGSGMDSFVDELTVFDDGTGAALYAAGNFTTAGGVTVNQIARWDGTSWASVGGGTSPSVPVYALTVFDDGTGPALYAGGSFSSAGGTPANSIARWDGTSWSALGSGTNPTVFTLAVHDDGTGPALYAGGGFTGAGGVSAFHIARWNGSSWSALGNGLTFGVGPFALASFDDGSGPALYAGGDFGQAGGTPVAGIARWKNNLWSAVGSGVSGIINAFQVFDDGAGPGLYVAGSFSTAGGLAANGIARWRGGSWSTLGDGSVKGTLALAVHDDGFAPTLHLGGAFVRAPSGDSYLAKWGCGPDITAPELSCPSEVFAIDPPTGAPGELVTFSVTAIDSEDPAPLVVCVPPSGSVFPRGTTIVSCTATDLAGNSASCQFPVTVYGKARRR